MNHTKHILWALALLSGSIHAADGVSVEAGYGYHTTMERLSWSRTWDRRWFADQSWNLTGYWDVGIGRWTPHDAAGGNHDVNDFGITPVWRLVPAQATGTVVPFAELAVGAHYISDHEIYNGRNMSTHFQFGDHVGAGLSFGPQHDWDAMLRFQHLSNAGLQNPNPGMNFYQVRLTHWY